MSYMFSIYTESNITQKEIWEFVMELGGDILYWENFSKGVIQQGEAAIWIYYRGKIEEWKQKKVDEIQSVTRLRVINEVAIEEGHNDYSDKLAAQFCIDFMKSYPKTVAVPNNDFLGLEEVIEWYEKPIIEY